MEYKAKVLEAGLKERGNGDVAAFIKFGYTAQTPSGVPSEQTIFWNGGFTTEKSAEYSMKALLSAGMYPSVKELMDIQTLGAKAFNPDAKFTITLEDRTHEGKTYKNVKYVNAMLDRKPLDGDKVKTYIAVHGLNAKLAAMKAELGLATTSLPHSSGETDVGF